MMLYEARFITHGDRVFGTERFEAQSDAHAIERSRGLFTSSIGKGFQLWQEDRLVHTELFRGPLR